MRRHLWEEAPGAEPPPNALLASRARPRGPHQQQPFFDFLELLKPRRPPRYQERRAVQRDEEALDRLTKELTEWQEWCVDGAKTAELEAPEHVPSAPEWQAASGTYPQRGWSSIRTTVAGSLSCSDTPVVRAPSRTSWDWSATVQHGGVAQSTRRRSSMLWGRAPGRRVVLFGEARVPGAVDDPDRVDVARPTSDSSPWRWRGGHAGMRWPSRRRRLRNANRRGDHAPSARRTCASLRSCLNDTPPRAAIAGGAMRAPPPPEHRARLCSACAAAARRSARSCRLRTTEASHARLQHGARERPPLAT